MKIGEYEQMMSYLTRPAAETRENFAKAGEVKDFSSLKNIRLSEGGNFRFDSQAGGKIFTKTFPADTDLKDVIKFRDDYLLDKGIEPGKIKKGPNPKRGKYLGVKGQKHIKFNGVTYEVSVQRMKDGKMVTEKPYYTSDLDDAIKVRDQRISKAPPKIQKGVFNPDREKEKRKIDERRTIQKTKEGRTNIAYKAPKGYQVHHLLPLTLAGPDTNTRDLAVISAQMNQEIAQFDKPIKNLTEEAALLDYNGDRKNSLKRLEEINKELNNIVKKGVKKLGPKYDGLIGFNELVPVYDSNGVIVDTSYKPVGIDFKKSIAKNVKVPEKVKNVSTPNLQKLASEAPKLKAALLPGLEQIVEGIKNIPDDVRKKKFFTLGLKALGPLGTYIAVDDTYEALKAGRPVAEALEYGLIGTDVIGSAKDLMALSPEEREARSVVKQAEMADQIAQDESMLDSDFETPKVKSDLTDEEAKRKYKLAQERIEAENKANEAKIARARAIGLSDLKDLITGKRFQPVEIPTQAMAEGGIMRLGFADGPDDPSRRKFMKIAGGIASIPLVGKYLKPAMVAAPKVVEVVKRSADGIPDFIGDLITKVVTLGKKSFTGSRADELEEVYELDNYVVTKQGEKTRVKKVDDQGEFGYKEHEMELDYDPETGGVTYNEASVRPDAEGKLKDVEEFIDDVDLEDMKKYTYDE